MLSANVHTLVFDFDGTLVDSYAEILHMYNEFAKNKRLRIISLEEAHELKQHSAKELFQCLNIPFYALPVLIHQMRRHMQQRILSLRPFSDIPFVLKTLCAYGYTLGIISTNSQTNICQWLHQYQLTDYFSFVLSSRHFFGKKMVLKQVLNRENIRPIEACYIGDETRDVEAALAAGVKAIAVTWGFNTENILSQYTPHCIIRTPLELLKIFNLEHDMINKRV